jgi:hypothetical protein
MNPDQSDRGERGLYVAFAMATLVTAVLCVALFWPRSRGAWHSLGPARDASGINAITADEPAETN